MRHHPDSFAIFGWREEDGSVTVVASGLLAVAEEEVRDMPALETTPMVPSGPYAGRTARFRLLDRTLRFVVEGTAEVAEHGHRHFVPPLLALLERWLPHEQGDVVEVEAEHLPDGNVYTSNPAQRKCGVCREVWPCPTTIRARAAADEAVGDVTGLRP